MIVTDVDSTWNITLWHHLFMILLIALKLLQLSKIGLRMGPPRSGSSWPRPVVAIIELLINISTSPPDHLINLITDNIPHLLLLFVYLDFNLSSQLLLLKPIQVTDHLKPWFQYDRGNKASKTAHHVHNSTTDEVNEPEFLEPPFTPDPRGTDWINDCSYVKGIYNVGS